MKTIYYTLRDRILTNTDGSDYGTIAAPDLFYQEHVVWRIFLRDRENTAADLSGVAAWGAAVAADFCAATAPMCRTLNSGVTFDITSGAVDVTLDAATPEFLAAVNGVAVRPAWFELYGMDASGRRIVHVTFEIRAHMTIDPDPTADTDTPDNIATQDWTVLAITRALTKYPAIVSGAEFTTTVGPYTVALTSGGGLFVSGAGAEARFSGGEIAASASGNVVVTGGDVLSIGADHVLIGGGISVELAGDHVTVNGAPAATRIVTSTDTVTTSAAIPVLSGGVAYIYTQPLTSLSVASVANAPAEDYIRFTLASGGSVSIPASVAVLNSGLEFEGGKEYLVAFNGGMMVAAEVTPGA
ncbi:MAG: hypothetical protein IJJ28_08650 [Lentisphaeria bacterium]|nr:hypothetical protein [Lentisphaeria bacterium]